MKFRRYILLFLSFLALVAALVLNFVFSQKANKKAHIALIEKNLAKETDIIDDILYDLKNKLDSKPTHLFSTLLANNYAYPVYIFEKSNLIYWSDYRYPVSYYEHFAGYYTEKCFQTRNGIFYAKKTYLLLEGRDLEIVAIVPLLEKYDLTEGNKKTQFHPTIFHINHAGSNIEIFLNSNIGEKVKSKYGIDLFNIQFPENFNYYPEEQFFVMLLALFGFSLFLVAFRQWIKLNLMRGKGLQMFIFLTLFLILLRFVMIFFQIPYKINESELFERTVKENWFAPSLGDWFLNLLCLITILIFLAKNFKKIVPIRKLFKTSVWIKRCIVILTIIFTYVTLYFANRIVFELHKTTKVDIDITQNLQISQIKIIALFTFILAVISYLIFTHWVLRLLNKLSTTTSEVIILFVVASIIYFGVFVIENRSLVEFNANALFICFSTFLNLPSKLRKTGYRALVYILFGATCCAFVGAFAISKLAARYDLEKKDNFVLQLVGNDPYVESSLQQAAQTIKQDKVVLEIFEKQDFSSLEILYKKIRKDYLPRQVQHYNLDVYFFNNKGIAINAGLNLENFLEIYNKPEHHTLYPDVLFVNEPAEGSKQYYCLVAIRNINKVLGHIILRLDKRRTLESSLQPALLISGFDPQTDILLSETFSFAVFEKNELVHSEGEFNYTKNFIQTTITNSNFFRKEIVKDDFHHLFVRNGRDRFVIVTSALYSFNNILSNFSFLFLFLAFIMITSMTVYNFSIRKKKKKFTFATKIQLYLNLAFFVPLMFVSAIIISVLNDSNIEETKKYFLNKAQSVSVSIYDKLVAQSKGEIRSSTLQEELEKISIITQADLHIYDKHGKLWFTSHSQTFENEFISSYVNPIAMARILEQKLNKVMLEENIGNLNYNAAYVNIKSVRTGEIIGILGIPFFQSKYEQDKQIIEVLTTIIKIFAIVFLILLSISFFSARSLIKPLLLVTQKIRHTSLNEHNEPIEYHSQDEFGILVKEYNKMIDKLEESKAALARSEKETAWREMAKQVAHEIKNPLTPMKLTLQHLDRTLEKTDKVKRFIKTLLNQIDTLSDIAASFAAFAKMPNLKEEKFDISKTLRETIALYSTNENVQIEKYLSVEPYYVIGDSKLMSRIFTNLILNGVQSVEKDILPNIKISIKKQEDDKVLIEFKDNGKGIPEHLQSKIFIPNFTTKSNGTGIGLAIAKRGIEHFGGKIWFETEENIGTSFFIEMPLIKE
ncbi:MAG: HAMP domain-containing sensor histidine kinase [Flammeovirgaceae bacterium]